MSDSKELKDGVAELVNSEVVNQEVVIEQNDDNEKLQEEKPKRRRGRPRKKDVVNDKNVDEKPKRKRGRPRKKDNVDGGAKKVSKAKDGAGRPRKPNEEFDADEKVGEIKAEVVAESDSGERVLYEKTHNIFSPPKVKRREDLFILEMGMKVTHSMKDFKFAKKDGSQLFSISYWVGGKLPCHICNVKDAASDFRKFLSEDINNFNKALSVKLLKMKKMMMEKGYIDE